MSNVTAEAPPPFWHLLPLDDLPKTSLHRTAKIALSSSDADVSLLCLLDGTEPWYTTGCHTDQLPPSVTSALCSFFSTPRETRVLTRSDLLQVFDEGPTFGTGQEIHSVVGTPLSIECRPSIATASPVGLLYVVRSSPAPPGPQVKECIDHLGELLEEQIRGWITRHGATQLVETLPEALLTLDRDAHITFVNRQAESLLGASRDHLLGQSVWEVMPDPMDSSVKNRLETTLNSGQPVSFRMPHPQLQSWVQIQTRPLDNGLLVHIDDISEEIEREKQLTRARQEAEKANRLKSTFLANMSHEIRTPLTSIIGFAEALQDQIAALEAHSDTRNLDLLSQFTTLIEQGGYRLLNTLNSLLNLSKLEAGEMNVSLQPIDLTSEVREMVDLYTSKADAEGLDLHYDLPDSPVRAHVDRQGIQITLRNLLSNAVKYTDEGGYIRICLRERRESVALEIEDSGIGMAPERVPDLFEAFKQESTGTNRTHEGAGLGLAVTKRLVDLMEGSIDVDSAKGEGTHFTLRFRRAPELVRP